MTTLTAQRDADRRYTFSPSSGFTFADLTPLMKIWLGEGNSETPALTVTLTATGNGSAFVPYSSSLVLTLDKADLAALPDGELYYDITLTDGTGFENALCGGLFDLVEDGADGDCGGCKEGLLTFNTNGQCITVMLQGGNLAVGASISLAALNAAVAAADASAASAAASAAAAAGAVAGKLNTDGTNPAAGLLTNIGAVASVDLADDTGAGLMGWQSAMPNAVSITQAEKNSQIYNTRDAGILTDGTDQTSAMVDLVTDLGTANFRGLLSIATGTKFDLPAVYAAVPVDVSLWDMSFCNYSDGSYKQRRLTYYGGDTVNNDSAFMIADGHNPALIFNNFRTSGSVSADEGVVSPIITAYGKNSYTQSEMINWQLRYDHDPVLGAGTIKDVLYSPILVCFGNPSAWATATVYAANSYAISDGGKLYKTTAGGTSGATAPTGTEATINDGGVIWAYQQPDLALEAIRYQRDELGNFSQFGPGAVRHTMSAGPSTGFVEVAANADMKIRNDTRGLDWFNDTLSGGLVRRYAQSDSYIAINANGQAAPATGAGNINYTGDFASLAMPSGRTDMEVLVRFDSGNNSVRHYLDGGGANFFLRDGVAVTPPAGSFMLFKRSDAYSSLWYEAYRSFSVASRGTTANRPTPLATSIGYLYLDNTLDADGKPIWWNGSAWVDATGAVV